MATINEERVLLRCYQRILDTIEKDLKEIQEHDVIDYTDLKTYEETIRDYYPVSSVGISCILNRIRAFKKANLTESQES